MSFDAHAKGPDTVMLAHLLPPTLLVTRQMHLHVYPKIRGLSESQPRGLACACTTRQRVRLTSEETIVRTIS